MEYQTGALFIWTCMSVAAIAGTLDVATATSADPAQAAAFGWPAIVGLIVGVVGTAASLISWLVGRRSRRQYDYLLRLAALNIDKETTEEKIQSMRQQATTLDSELGDLRRSIERDLPVEARRAVLRDRLDAAISVAAHSYDDVVRTKKELADLGSPKEIPQHLLEEIESIIEPRYLRREQISDRKTFLTIISAAAAVASTLLPYPIGRFAGATLLLISVPVIASLVRLTFDPMSIRRWRKTILLIVVAAVCWLGACVLALGAYFDGYRPHELWQLSALGSAVVGGIAAVLAYFSVKRLRAEGRAAMPSKSGSNVGVEESREPNG